MEKKEPLWIGNDLVIDLTPLIKLAAKTDDHNWFRELVSRNKLYWRYAGGRKGY